VPPAAEGVFEEEGDHVLLGEKLRHRRQFVGAHLGAGLLHLPLHFFLLRRLPELVAPAQAVVGLEDGGGQLGEQGFERLFGFQRHLDRQGRAVGAEDVGQHACGVVAGDFPFATGGRVETQLRVLGVFLAVGQADRVAVRVHQQIALGEEAGKEHAVPVLVGDFRDEVVDGLRVVGAQHVAQCATMGAQAHAQFFLGIAGVGGGIPGTDGEGLQGFLGAGFGLRAGLRGGVLEDAAMFAGKGLRHGESASRANCGQRRAGARNRGRRRPAGRRCRPAASHRHRPGCGCPR
jgi:hypothetical protein